MNRSFLSFGRPSALPYIVATAAASKKIEEAPQAVRDYADTQAKASGILGQLIGLMQTDQAIYVCTYADDFGKKLLEHAAAARKDGASLTAQGNLGLARLRYADAGSLERLANSHTWTIQIGPVIPGVTRPMSTPQPCEDCDGAGRINDWTCGACGGTGLAGLSPDNLADPPLVYADLEPFVTDNMKEGYGFKDPPYKTEEMERAPVGRTWPNGDKFPNSVETRHVETTGYIEPVRRFFTPEEHEQIRQQTGLNFANAYVEKIDTVQIDGATVEVEWQDPRKPQSRVDRIKAHTASIRTLVLQELDRIAVDAAKLADDMRAISEVTSNVAPGAGDLLRRTAEALDKQRQGLELILQRRPD